MVTVAATASAMGSDRKVAGADTRAGSRSRQARNTLLRNREQNRASRTWPRAVALIFVGKDGQIENEENFVDATDVSMHKLTDDEIESYISTDEPYDKAGGYGIQGKGALLIDSICGDYYTVVGLPLSILYRCLRKNGINTLDFWK